MRFGLRPLFMAETNTTIKPGYTFRPRKRTDSGVWRRRQPSWEQAKAKANRLLVQTARAAGVAGPVKLSAAMPTGLVMNQFSQVLVGLFNQLEDILIRRNVKHKKPFASSLKKTRN
jgi:hypothetical protein